MKFGVVLPIWRLTMAEAERMTLRAEELGWDGVFVPDHIMAKPATTQHYGPSWPDPFSLLAFLAGRTHRIQVGASVIVLPYRNPLVAAKAAATVDQVSGGRFIFGIGVGWDEAEFKDLGLPFRSAARWPMSISRSSRPRGRRTMPSTRPLSHVRRGHVLAAPGPEAASAGVGGRRAGRALGAGHAAGRHPLRCLASARPRLGRSRAGHGDGERAGHPGRPAEGAVRFAPRNLLGLGAKAAAPSARHTRATPTRSPRT